MAETENIKIIIETEYKVTNADSAKETLNNVKKSASETKDTFGIQNTALGKIWNNIQTGGKMAVNSFKTLKGAIISTGIGALLIAVMGIVNWFKRTETGSDLLAQGMKALGQVVKEGPMVAFNALKILIEAIILPFRTATSVFKNVKDVISGKDSIKEAFADVKQDVKGFTDQIVNDAKKIGQAGKNVKAAWDLEGIMDAIDDDRRKSLKKTKELEQSIAEAREKAVDIDLSRTERTKAYNDVLGSMNEKSKIELDLLQREFDVKKADLALDTDNLDKKLALEAAENALIDAKTNALNERRNIQRQLNNLDKQETADKKKEQEEQEKNAQEAADKEKERLDKADEERKKSEQSKVDVFTAFMNLQVEAGKKLAEEEIDRQKKAKEAEAEDAKTKEENRQKALSGAANSLMQFAALAGKQSKAGKVLAIAAALIDTYQSATAAFKSLAGIPIVGPALGATAAAAAVAMGLKNVATIRKTEPEKKHAGGWITGFSDEVPIIAQRKEYMVNKNAMSNTSNAATVQSINSGSGVINLSIDSINAIVNGINNKVVYMDEEGSYKSSQMAKSVEVIRSRFVK